MINPNQLKIGNAVTINNSIAWAKLKNVPMIVTGIELINVNQVFPQSTATIRLTDETKYPKSFNQFNEFIYPIKINENELISLGFRKTQRGKIIFVLRNKNFTLRYRIPDKNNPSSLLSGLSIDFGSTIKYFKNKNYVHQIQNLYFELTNGKQLKYNKMKTRLEWFNTLPEPARTQAIENTKEASHKSLTGKCHSFEAAIHSFGWFASPQGFDYWEAIANNKLYNK